MTSFGNDSKFASVLGAVGGAISMAASIGMLADNKMNKASEKNEENKETKEKTDETKETDNKEKTTEQKKADKQAKKEAKAAAKKAKALEKQEKKAKLEEAKAAKKAQKEEAKTSDLSSKEKKNMKENGASKEYANVRDEELAEQIEYYQGEGNDPAKADKLSTEMAKRGDYKDKMAVIADNKAKTGETVSKVTDAIGKTVQGVTSVMNMNNGKQQDQRKRPQSAVPVREGAKKALKKNKKYRKRIAALAKRGH